MASPYGHLGRGLGGAIASFFNGDGEQAGTMDGLKQVALQGTIEQGRAHADALRADAEKKQQEAALRTPQSTIGRVLMGLGIPTDNAPDAQQWLQSGRVDKFDTGGQAGPSMPAPDWYTPDVRTKVGQQFAGEQAVQAGSAKHLEDYFKAQGSATINSAVAKALAGGDVTQVAQLQSKDPLKVAQSLVAGRIGSGELVPAVGGARMAAMGGHQLYHADGTGAVLDVFGGGLDTTNPLAGTTINQRTQQAAQAQAGAVENLAQAKNADASAGLHRVQAGNVGVASAGGGPTSAAAGFSDAAIDSAAARYNADGSLPSLGGGKPAAAARQAVLNRAAELSGGKPPPPKSTDKPLNDGQSKALLFGSRMEASDKMIGELAAKGAMLPSLTKQAVEKVPLVGGGLGMIANATVASPAQQQVEQAQRDFLNATLRRESGAVISDAEFANGRHQYFPQPGDSKEVLAQKAANRKLATNGVLAEVPVAQRSSLRLPSAGSTDPLAGFSTQQQIAIARDMAASGVKPADARFQAAGAQTVSNPFGAAAPAPGVVAVKSDADYAALLKGARFVTPEGRMGTKR